MKFQPTPPHRGRPCKVITKKSRPKDFNPRPRTGGDPMLRMALSGGEISTHAPAQGATLKILLRMAMSREFQPTPPHRGRPGDGGAVYTADRISTHAPAQGATQCQRLCEAADLFQPTPPHRGRQQKQPKQNPRFPLNPAPPPNPHPPKHHPQDLPPRTPPISPGKPGAKPLRSPARFPFAPTISEHPPGRKSP